MEKVLPLHRNHKGDTNMTLAEIITEQTGYEMKTTFTTDFAIAERFGAKAIQDTFNRAFKEWKGNHIYLTELVIVLNWKIWQWYEKRDDFAKLYDKCWRIADEYAVNNLQGEELSYFYQVTD